MQIEAFYENGNLEFTHQVQFKHARVRLIVDVPDDEVEHAESTPAQAQATQAMQPAAHAVRSVADDIAAILSPWRDRLDTLEALSKNTQREHAATEWEERHRAER